MQNKYRILLHAIIWLTLFSYSMVTGYQYEIYKSAAYHNDLTTFVVVSFAYFTTKIIDFYITAYLIAPQFFKHRRWALGVFYILFFFAFSTALRYLLEFHILLPLLNFNNYKGASMQMWPYIENNVNYVFYSDFIYGFIFYMVSERYANGRKQKELEKEKIAAELSFLKSQVNPHFLFNTLNDIYVLTYRQSPEAPHAVLKLSELLRYMLRESDDTFVPLHKEIEYLKNVIDLYLIGQKGLAFIEIETKGDVQNQEIAPLVLINFVENAFKHGVTNDVLHPIKIVIDIQPDYFGFSVTNQKNQDHKDSRGGIGLANVKRRLDLIYPNKHLLQIEDKAHSFAIYLKLEWN